MVIRGMGTILIIVQTEAVTAGHVVESVNAAERNECEMTLIEVRNSEGVVGRCNALCYEATTPDCQCVCGGANHGAGQQRAMDNTRQMAENWIEEYARRHDLRDYHGEINPQCIQLSLFEGGA